MRGESSSVIRATAFRASIFEQRIGVAAAELPLAAAALGVQRAQPSGLQTAATALSPLPDGRCGWTGNQLQEVASSSWALASRRGRRGWSAHRIALRPKPPDDVVIGAEPSTRKKNSAECRCAPAAPNCQ